MLDMNTQEGISAEKYRESLENGRMVSPSQSRYPS